MALGIKRFRRLARFKKAYRKLSHQHRTAVDDALRQLMNANTLPASRNPKRVQAQKKLWAIRVTEALRMTFEVTDDGTCILRNVGDHDKVLANP